MCVITLYSQCVVCSPCFSLIVWLTMAAGGRGTASRSGEGWGLSLRAMIRWTKAAQPAAVMLLQCRWRDEAGRQLPLVLRLQPRVLQDAPRWFGCGTTSGFTIMLPLQLLAQVATPMLCRFSASAPLRLMRELRLDSQRRAPFVAGFCFKLCQT